MGTSSDDYSLAWAGRKGFAELASAAGVTLVPMFTRNIRECFLVLGGNWPLVQRLYKATKLPFTPFVGPLPIPLTTVLGTPIPHVAGAPIESIARQAVYALQMLMLKNHPQTG